MSTSGHKLQAATTCRPAQLGRWGRRVGTGVNCGMTLPSPQRPAGSAEEGPSGHPATPASPQAAGPALHNRPALERGTFHAYFVLCTVQKELTAPALAPSPALISHPESSQLAS